MKITVAPQGDTTLVTLKGNLTEEAEAELLTLPSQLVTAKVVFDFGGVAHLNSYGIARWYRFVSEAAKRSRLEFRNCPLNVVETMTMLPRFTSGGAVTSLLVPYTCDECGTTSTICVDCAKAEAASALPPSLCAKCGSASSPDVDPEVFREFVSSR